MPYASLESVVEDNKDLYYKALRRTQTTLKTDTPDWEPWLGFFLRCLKRQKANLAAKIEKEKAGDVTDLPPLSVQVLELLKKHERLTIAELVEYTGANQNTLKVRLRELVAMGRIHRHGKARATWYISGDVTVSDMGRSSCAEMPRVRNDRAAARRVRLAMALKKDFGESDMPVSVRKLMNQNEKNGWFCHY